MSDLSEKYRPQSLDTVIGQDRAIKQTKNAMKRGIAGKSIWYSGPPGGGKTTTAYCVAKDFAGDNFDESCDIVGRECTVERLKNFQDSLSMTPMFGKGRVLIINEAQDLSASCVSLLLSILESVKRTNHTAVIFTAMKDVMDSCNEKRSVHWDALLSRCVQIELSDIGNPAYQESVLRHLASVCRAEGIVPDVSLMSICRDAKWNIRAAITALEMFDVDPEGELIIDDAVDTTVDIASLTDDEDYLDEVAFLASLAAI